jgi:hypothetical protein
MKCNSIKEKRMFKRVLATALLACSIPAMASAASWPLTTQALTAGGSITSRNMAGQTASNGSIFKSYTTHQPIGFSVNPATGYGISKITVNGTNYPAGTGAPATVTGFSAQTVTAAFTALPQNVTASVVGATGGTVSPASVANIYYGTKLTSPLVFTFTPKAGYSLTGLTGNGGATTAPALPAPANTAVRVTLPVGYVFTAPVALSGTFTSANPIANAGAPQTVLAGATVTLTGTYAGGSSAPNYTWSEVSGPATVTLAAGNPVSFTAGTLGSYVFKVTLDSGSIATTVVTVTDSALTAAQNQCAACHTNVGVGAGVYEKWSASAHSSKLVMCYTCHVGSNTGSHPGAVVTAATCESCHAAPALSQITHPADLTAAKCITCHNAHDPAAGIANLQASAHPAVTLYTFEEIGMQMAGGQKVPVQVDAAGKGMPYSPKQTCGTSGCHVKNGVDYTYDKISDHAFHSNEGRTEYQDSSDGKFDATKNKPWGQSTAMVGKW